MGFWKASQSYQTVTNPILQKAELASSLDFQQRDCVNHLTAGSLCESRLFSGSGTPSCLVPGLPGCCSRPFEVVGSNAAVPCVTSVRL